MRAIGHVSGGMGSYSAVRRYVDQHGSDDLTLLFTDTLFEDQDAYRFLIQSSADLFDITLPAGFVPAIGDFPAWEDRTAYKAFVLGLAARTMMEIPGLQWISDGRDPWDVYEAENFLGNTRIDPCSKILKRQASDRWILANCDSTDTVLIFGIDIEEQHRFDDGLGGGIRPRRAKDGWTALAPLCDPPYRSYGERLAELVQRGLWLPRLNRLGFAHNNCGGFCCKAGLGHFKLMLQVFPERFTYCEMREDQLRTRLGWRQAILRDRRGGTTKALPLRHLRDRELRPDEASDMGGCGCFIGEAA